MAQCLSIAAFGSYGAACFVSPHITHEFERYRLPHLRRLTGILEIAGALGLLVGLWFDPLRILAAASLAMLMVFAILARFRIRDSLVAMSPALFLLALNVFISVAI